LFGRPDRGSAAGRDAAKASLPLPREPVMPYDCTARAGLVGHAAVRRWLATAALLLVAAVLDVAAQDTRTIQLREAQRTDGRTFAAFAQFRTALATRFGADPLLSMLVFSESEGQALVHRAPGGPAEHVIYQGGNWISADGRQLRPWTTNADPAVALFRLSSISEPLLREKFRAHRAQPARATDHLGEVRIGYFGAPFERLIGEIQVASMATFGLSTIAFDLRSGQPLDVNAALANARAQRAAAERKDAAEAKLAASRNLRDEIPGALAQFRREVGPARLMAVWIARERITFIQADRAIVDYDQRGTFKRRKDPYDQVWLCTEGFDDRDLDWAGLTALIDKAMLARNLDEEDREYAEISVERPRECAPVAIEVKFTNYTSPYPYASFDAKGRLGKVR
jgi:hypothetical protein